MSSQSNAIFFLHHLFTGFTYPSGTNKIMLMSDLGFPENTPDVLIVSVTVDSYVEFDDELIKTPTGPDGIGTPTTLANTFFTVPLRPKKINVQGVSSNGTFKIFAFWD